MPKAKKRLKRELKEMRSRVQELQDQLANAQPGLDFPPLTVCIVDHHQHNYRVFNVPQKQADEVADELAADDHARRSERPAAAATA